MNDENQVISYWPAALGEVDVVKLRFALDFLTPCSVQPSDFLGLGRSLRLTGRQLFDTRDTTLMQQWERLFLPQVSNDPVARKKFQKPAPAFVLTMPVAEKKSLDSGDRLCLHVLFIGTGISSIHHFLRSLVHLGQLGLVRGDGRYDVTEVEALQPDGQYMRAWRQAEPTGSLVCPVQNLLWLVQKERIADELTLRFTTPTRLMVDGKPLRKPRFDHVFPFMLRRVTSMLYAHCGIEICEDSARLVDAAHELESASIDFSWTDWRSIAKSRDLSVGGFTGDLQISGPRIEELYWVLSVTALFGVGKGASYGAGQVDVLTD